MKSRALIFVTVLGVVAIAAGWIYESRMRPGADTAELVIPDNIDYFMTNLNYRSIDANGRLDYEFSSRRLEHHPRDDVSKIDRPALNIYRETDNWEVNAMQGELRHQDNRLWLREQVVMQKTGADSFEILTESIHFEPQQNMVSIDMAVLMRGKKVRIEAETALLDLAGKVYRLSGTRAVYFHEDI
jgi:LPS export ABC transporter protein LptC